MRWHGVEEEGLMGRDESDPPVLPGLPNLAGLPLGSSDAGMPGLPLPWAGLPTLAPDGPRPAPPASPGADGRDDSRTLTQQMRNIQPPDVGRQVMSELGVLASELARLPTDLAQAGLSQTHLAPYLDATQDYLSLCRYAWEAVAEEQLEQVGAQPDYRQSAVGVARQIARLRDACAEVTVLPRRPRHPLQWRRRVSLVRLGLQAWREQIEPVPNPLRLGRALFELQGDIALASAGGLELLLVDWLTSATGALLGLLSLGTLLLLITDIARGMTSQALGDGAIAFICLVGLILTLILGIASPLPIGPLLGASIYGPSSAASLGWQGSRVTTVLLRVWWLLVGSAATLAVPISLVLGGVLLAHNEPLKSPATIVDALRASGEILLISLALPATVCLVALLALLAPFTFVAAVRFAREMATIRVWVPDARRYALLPALTTVAVVTSALLLAGWWLGTMFGWEHLVLLRLDLPVLHGAITLRAVLLALVLVLPYEALMDVPYRLGIRGWRAQRLADLERQRAELESQVRRLATQEASDQVLRAMQYDLVLLQFYRGQMDEARRTTSAPFRLEGRIVAAVLAVVSAVVLDGGGVLVGQLFALR